MRTAGRRAAFKTWPGRGRRNLDVAREGAQGLLQQIGHPLAGETARRRLVRIVTNLGSGGSLTRRGRAELTDAVRRGEPDSVFAASGIARAAGHPDATRDRQSISLVRAHR
ncbi:hypothetical protein Sliba_79060 [Streptomyces nigrescens]|uniref:Uncharacterized protein n=1 Tax=Streptomyces nigrescens TaxID=1920 RepID=A0A640TTN3_STRNI|nr:hypothetical protein Sliba_79060 [Streptomyces libani subsp. libani]GGV96096.1 hypothetical protein GCM10010500_38010 [Streptomyces libani subsp. libani]